MLLAFFILVHCAVRYCAVGVRYVITSMCISSERQAEIRAETTGHVPGMTGIAGYHLRSQMRSHASG